MSTWERFKGWISRAGDWLTGNDVAVSSGSELAPPAAAPRVPLVDVFENDDEVLMRLDVAGATPHTTTVTVDGGEMRISAGAHDVTWVRSFRLPREVDGERARATVRRGVLTVRVPKRSGPAPRLIPVRAS